MQKLQTVPDLLDGLMSQEVYQKTRIYALDRNSFGIFKALFENVFKTVSVFLVKVKYLNTKGVMN